MDFDQIIGYVVTFLALIYFMRQSRRKEATKSENSQDAVHEKHARAKKLKDFLKSLNDEMDDDDDDEIEKLPIKHKPLHKNVVVPKKVVQPDYKPDLYHQKSTIEDRRLKSSIEERKFQTSIENRHLRTNIESRYDDPYGKRTKILDLKSQADAPSYDVIGKSGGSKANEIMANLKSRKQMIILQEIISPPKSLRRE
jgi:hypothetical protein